MTTSAQCTLLSFLDAPEAQRSHQRRALLDLLAKLATRSDAVAG